MLAVREAVDDSASLRMLLASSSSTTPAQVLAGRMAADSGFVWSAILVKTMGLSGLVTCHGMHECLLMLWLLWGRRGYLNNLWSVLGLVRG